MPLTVPFLPLGATSPLAFLAAALLVVVFWRRIRGLCRSVMNSEEAELLRRITLMMSPAADVGARAEDPGPRTARPRVHSLASFTGKGRVIAFSPVDDRMAVGNQQNGLISFEDRGGPLSAVTLASGQATLSRLVYSPDGRFLASEGSDGSVLVWKLASKGWILRCNSPQRGLSKGLAFDCQGGTLAILRSSGCVSVFGVHSAEKLFEVEGSPDRCDALAIGPAGELLLSVPDGGPGLRPLELLGRPKPVVLLRHGGRPGGSVFSSQGDSLLTLQGSSLELHSPVDEGWRTVASHEVTSIESACLSGDGRRVATLGVGWARIYQRDAWQLLQEFPTGEDSGTALALDSTGDVLMVGSHQPERHVLGHGPWRPRRRGPRRPWTFAIACSPDGKTVALGAADGTVRIWERGFRLEQARLVASSEPITSLAFTPDGEGLAVLSRSERKVHSSLWNAATGEWLRDLPHSITAIAFDPTNERVYAGLAEGRVLALSRDDLEVVWFSPRSCCEFHRLVLSHDGQHLAAVDREGSVVLIETRSGKERWRLPGYGPMNPAHVAFTEGDTALRILTHGVGVYALSMGPTRDVQLLFKGIDGFGPAAISPDGKVFARIEDGLLFRDAETGRLLERRPEVEEGVFSLAFSPSGEFLVAGFARGGGVLLPCHGPVASKRRECRA